MNLNDIKSKVVEKKISNKVAEIIENLLNTPSLKTNLILCKGKLDEILVNSVIERQLMLRQDSHIISIDCGRKYKTLDQEHPGYGIEDFLKEKLCLRQHEIEECKQKKEQIIILFKNYDRLGVYENLYVKNKLSNWPNLKCIVTCDGLFFQHRNYESCFLPDPGVIDLSLIKSDEIVSVFSEEENDRFYHKQDEGMRRSSIVEIKDNSTSNYPKQIKIRALHTELSNFLRIINKAFIENATLKDNIEENSKIFISYAWEKGNVLARQQKHLKQIAKDLYTLGFLTWLDIERMIGNIDQQMEGNIASSDYVLLIGTPLYTERAAMDTNVKKEFDAIIGKKVAQKEKFTIFPIKFLQERYKFNSFPETLITHSDYCNLLDFCGIDDGEEYIKQLTSLSNPIGLIPMLLDLHAPGKEDKLAEYTKQYEVFQKQLQLLPASHLLVDKGQDDVQAYDIDGRLEVYIEPYGVKINPAVASVVDDNRVVTEDLSEQFTTDGFPTVPRKSGFILEKSLSNFLKHEQLKTYVALGDAGSGKTLFTLWTFKKYVLQPWHNYRNKELKIYLCKSEPLGKDKIEPNSIYLFLERNQGKEDIQEIKYSCIVKNYKHENDSYKETQVITIDQSKSNSEIYTQIEKELKNFHKDDKEPKLLEELLPNYDRNKFFNLLKPKWLPIYIPLKNYSYPGKNKEGQERKKDDKQTPLSYIEDALLSDYHISPQDILNLKKGLNQEQHILFILDGYDELGKGNNPNFSQALLNGVEDVYLCPKKPNELKKNHIYVYLNDLEEEPRAHILFNNNSNRLIDEPITNQQLASTLKKTQIASLKSPTRLLEAALLEEFFKYTYGQHKNDLTSHTINYKYVKIFVTGRPEHFDNEKQHEEAFTLLDYQKPIANIFEVNYMARFSNKDIEHYITKYKAADRKCAESLEKLEKDKKQTTLEILNSFGKLTELLQNPFLLNITLQALPILLKKYQDSISRATVYQGFIEYWYTKEIERKNQALQRSNLVNTTKEYEKSKETCYKFAEDLVMQMFINNTISISEKFPELWTFFNTLYKSFARETCPLRRSGNEYSFIHKSVYEYFLARYLLTTPWDTPDICLTLELPPESDLCQGKIYLRKQGDKIGYTLLSLQGLKITDKLDIQLKEDLTQEYLNEHIDDILKLMTNKGHIACPITKINNPEYGYNVSIVRLLKEEPSVFSFIQDFARPFLPKTKQSHIEISSSYTQETNLYKIFLELLRWNELSLAERLITGKSESHLSPAYELTQLAYESLLKNDATLIQEIIPEQMLEKGDDDVDLEQEEEEEEQEEEQDEEQEEQEEEEEEEEDNNSNKSFKHDIIAVSVYRSILISYRTYQHAEPYLQRPFNPECLKDQLNILLNLVGFGEQAAAEKILLLNPELAIKRGNIVDCTGRLYKGISALQYAVWALDYHMWSMILKYIYNDNLQEIARAQLTELQPALSDTGFITTQEINNHWPSLTWQPLIEAYKKYLNEGYSTEVWQKQVGGAQLILPAHVINEYSHPNRPNGFKNCKWGGNDKYKLPRIGVIDWKSVENGEYILGKNFAWARGYWTTRANWMGDESSDDARTKRNVGKYIYKELDACAVTELMKARVEQARMLLSSKLLLVPQLPNV